MIHSTITGKEDKNENDHDDNKHTMIKSLQHIPTLPHLTTTRHINSHQYTFVMNNTSPNQLLDREANGGLAGSDMKIMSNTGRKTNIVGIDNHELTGLDIVTAATLLPTDKGIIYLTNMLTMDDKISCSRLTVMVYVAVVR